MTFRDRYILAGQMYTIWSVLTWMLVRVSSAVQFFSIRQNTLSLQPVQGLCWVNKCGISNVRPENPAKSNTVDTAKTFGEVFSSEINTEILPKHSSAPLGTQNFSQIPLFPKS